MCEDVRPAPAIPEDRLCRRCLERMRIDGHESCHACVRKDDFDWKHVAGAVAPRMPYLKTVSQCPLCGSASAIDGRHQAVFAVADFHVCVPCALRETRLGRKREAAERLARLVLGKVCTDYDSDGDDPYGCTVEILDGVTREMVSAAREVLGQ